LVQKAEECRKEKEATAAIVNETKQECEDQKEEGDEGEEMTPHNPETR